MLRIVFLTMVTLILTVPNIAQAKHHTKSTKTIVIVKPDEKMQRELAELKTAFQDLKARAEGPTFLGSIPYKALEPVKVASLGPTNVTVETPRDLTLRGVPTDSLPPPLKAMLHKIQDTCEGFKVISACRPGARVRGSGRISLHSSCKAADIVVRNYPCAYTALRGFPGGVSTDPGAVHHIHVSYSPQGREWGSRFAHYGSRHTRYARHSRHIRHYAKA